jgi:hypothetical protein
MRDYKHIMIQAQRKRKGLIDEEPLKDKLLGGAFVLCLILLAAFL